MPNGAPSAACGDMTPQHEPFLPDDDESGYTVDVRRQAQKYTSMSQINLVERDLYRLF